LRIEALPVATEMDLVSLNRLSDLDQLTTRGLGAALQGCHDFADGTKV
jgi:hypothetical protein